MIIDLPGARAVELGMNIASAGFFPVPLFNGVNAPAGVVPVVDNSEIQWDLAKKADLLEWPQSGGPAFLLDSRRISEKPVTGRFFDNRWIAMLQDFPSGDKLKSENVGKCYVVTDQESIPNDLQKILLQWQDAGIRIFLWKNMKFEEMKISPPNIFQRFFYRIRVAFLGLSPNPAGGFGALIERTGG